MWKCFQRYPIILSLKGYTIHVFDFTNRTKKMRILVKIKTLKLCVHPLMCIVDEKKKKKKLATKRNRVCKCIRSVASFFFHQYSV